MKTRRHSLGGKFWKIDALDQLYSGKCTNTTQHNPPPLSLTLYVDEIITISESDRFNDLNALKWWNPLYFTSLHSSPSHFNPHSHSPPDSVTISRKIYIWIDFSLVYFSLWSFLFGRTIILLNHWSADIWYEELLFFSLIIP